MEGEERGQDLGSAQAAISEGDWMPDWGSRTLGSCLMLNLASHLVHEVQRVRTRSSLNPPHTATHTKFFMKRSLNTRQSC